MNPLQKFLFFLSGISSSIFSVPIFAVGKPVKMEPVPVTTSEPPLPASTPLPLPVRVPSKSSFPRLSFTEAKMCGNGKAKFLSRKGRILTADVLGVSNDGKTIALRRGRGSTFVRYIA